MVQALNILLLNLAIMLSIKENRHPLYSLQNQLKRITNIWAFFLLCVCVFTTTGASQLALLVKNPTNAGEIRGVSLIPGWGRPLEKARQPTPVFFLGGSPGQRSLAGYLLSMVSQRVEHDWSDLAHTHIRNLYINYLEFVNSFRSCLFQYSKRL